VIVPAPAGGTVDLVARVIGQQITVDTGRPVIVENRPGATGAIGLSAMLKADPDGNTIALGPNNMLVEAPLMVKVPFDPLKDIASIARVALTGYVLVSAATSPAKDFPGLVAHLKTRKDKSSFASYGTGTVSQYSGLIFSSRADLGMQHVAYLGSPPALQDVIGSRVDIMFDGLVTSLPLIKSGTLRAYAVAGKNRYRQLPEVPTMTELGYADIQFQGIVKEMDQLVQLEKTLAQESFETASAAFRGPAPGWGRRAGRPEGRARVSFRRTGKTLGIRRASIVLPVPGGPESRRLWPPATTTSIARRANG